MKIKTNVIKNLISMICLLLILLSVSGCSSKNKIIPLTDDSDTITYSWWGNSDRHEYTMEGIDIFDKENPDIDVSCSYSSWNGYPNRMHIYMMSHDEPDVMLITYGWLLEYSPNGEGFYDLNKLTDYIDLGGFSENELKYGEVNGKLNAIPIAFNTQSLYYNKTIFDKYNLNVPETWEDLFADAKVLSRDDIYVLCMGQKPLFMLLTAYFEQTTGRNTFDDEGNIALTEKDIEYMLDFYKRLIDEKVLMPIDDFDRSAFVTEQAAGTMAWISDAGNYCDGLKEKGRQVIVGDYLCEKGSSTLGWYVKPATMYAISNITNHPKEAARLLNFLINNEDMTLLAGTEKGIPINENARNVLEKKDLMQGFEFEADSKLKENQDNMKLMNPNLEDEAVYKEFKSQGDYYLYGKQTLEDTATAIYNKFYGK